MNTTQAISYNALSTADLYELTIDLEYRVNAMQKERFELSLTVEQHDTKDQERLVQLNESIEVMVIERNNAGRQYKNREDRD